MIRYAHAGDLADIRALWERCFPDESGFNAYFFEHLFDRNAVLLYQLDGQLAAMTQMIPYPLQLDNGETVRCTYIYGACTHPAHRKKGLMRALLERSFVLDRALGRAGSMLIPAEDWLFSFYAPFGYSFRMDWLDLLAVP